MSSMNINEENDELLSIGYQNLKRIHIKKCTLSVLPLVQQKNSLRLNVCLQSRRDYNHAVTKSIQ
jgi:hypothetical protein